MNKEIESIINYYINNYVARDKVGDYIEELQQENKELHNKIDKAIEYIEDYGHGYDCTGDGYYCLDEDNQKDLLKILKNSDVDVKDKR